MRISQGNTHSVGSESRQYLIIDRLVSNGVIDKHPRTGRRSMGKGDLPKLGYEVEVVSNLAQSRTESPVVELVPADSIRHRHKTEAQLLAGKRRLHLRREMCRFCKIDTVAAQANDLRIPGKHQRTRDGRFETSTINIRVAPGLHPAQKSPVAHVVIVF